MTEEARLRLAIADEIYIAIRKYEQEIEGPHISDAVDHILDLIGGRPNA